MYVLEPGIHLYLTLQSNKPFIRRVVYEYNGTEYVYEKPTGTDGLWIYSEPIPVPSKVKVKLDVKLSPASTFNYSSVLVKPQGEIEVKEKPIKFTNSGIAVVLGDAGTIYLSGLVEKHFPQTNDVTVIPVYPELVVDFDNKPDAVFILY